MSEQGYHLELQSFRALVLNPVFPQTDFIETTLIWELLFFFSFSARREKPDSVGSIPQPPSHLSGRHARCHQEWIACRLCLGLQNDRHAGARNLEPVINF